MAKHLDGAFEVLRAHFSKRIDLTDEEFEFITTLFVPRKIRKRQFLLREGEVSGYGAFVSKGCLRKYSVDAKGEEHIVQFAIEDWWIGDQESLKTGRPSTYNIDALEESELLLLDKASSEEFFSSSPKIERFMATLAQNAMEALQRRITTFLSMSAKEKYLFMIATYPKIIQRIPQRHIASYLGLTPESLSRVRKELAEEKSKYYERKRD